jgi:hypothetical protein
MSKAKTHRSVASLVLGVACIGLSSTARAASPVVLSGAITGIVSDNLGIPQMGATVLLYNKQDRTLSKVQTDARGEFKFAGLFPELYSIRVSLASFLPAFKRDIQVQPGMRSVLHVNLSTLLSTIQLSYPTALESGSIMSDDWKWVLRSATATRPILRLIEPKPGVPVDPAQRAAVFSDTRGVLKVSAGEGASASGIATEADMGTAFALATALYGSNLLQVSGNLGYGAQTGAPSAAFRTSYSRNVAGTTPEVSLTMRQLFMPSRLNAALAGNDAALPMIRSMTASYEDSNQEADNVTLRYGTTLDTVTFLNRLSYFSPFAQLTVGSDDVGKLQMTYTSGNARPELGAADSIEADLQQDLNTLGMFPRVSLRGGRPRIQRGENYEIALSRKLASRLYSVSAYHEIVHNAALSMVAPEGMFDAGDVLPDVFTGNSIFNIGDYQSSGFSAAVTQSFGDHISATVTYGSEGGLTADRRELLSQNPDDLRAMIRSGRKHAATARVNVTAPHAGTRIVASYQWSDQEWAMSGNLYSTQPGRQLPGLNVYVRQPLPRVGLLPWRMEATADLRNMLAQGYLPMMTAGGQRLLLVETPRSFRGGLSFIF